MGINVKTSLSLPGLPPTCWDIWESLGKATLIMSASSLGMIGTNGMKLLSTDWNKNLEYIYITGYVKNFFIDITLKMIGKSENSIL